MARPTAHPQEGRTGAVCLPLYDASGSSPVTQVAAMAASAWPIPDLAAGHDLHQDSGKRRGTEASKRSSKFTATPLWVRLSLSAAIVAAMVAVEVDILPGVAPSAMVIVFIAAALSSIAGFAFSALCGALLFHVMAPLAAVQLMIVCSIAIQTLSVFALRATIDLPLLSRYLCGGIAGLPFGVFLLLHLDRNVYCQIMGGFLIVYGSYMLLRPATSVPSHWKWADSLAGFWEESPVASLASRERS